MQQPVPVAVRRTFEKYDTDKNGKLDFGEFVQVVRDLHLALEREAPSEQAVEGMFQQLGKSKQDSLSVNEFHGWWNSFRSSEELKAQIAEEGSEGNVTFEANALFRSYDRDGNGVLDKQELSHLLADLFMSHGFGEPSIAHINAAMQSLDKDGNGKISFSEFLPWWKKYQNSEAQKRAAK
ncbi:Calcium-binding allergen Ole e 8 [Balamuthia mandrillaris]